MDMFIQELLFSTWKEGKSYEGDYVIEMDVELKSQQLYSIEEDYLVMGNANILITNEAWVTYREDCPFHYQIFVDFIDERNSGGYTPIHFLEDAILSVGYGENQTLSGTIAFINTIEIYKEYRGKNLFETYLNSIINRCKKMNVDYILLQPHPVGNQLLSEEELTKGKKRLKKFYNKMGFTEIQNETKVDFMSYSIK